MKKINLLLFLGTLIITGCAATNPSQETAAVMLDVFPESVVQVPSNKLGKTKLSSTYTKTGSLWGKHLDEKNVFNFEIKHLQDKNNSYNLRIGKGGQLYSLRGAFGESIPPQSVGSPWNDEVWQFVAVCTKYNSAELKNVSKELAEKYKNAPYAKSYFIHNSGAYMKSWVDSGAITFSANIMLDRKKPGQLNIMMRDNTQNPVITFASLQVKKGDISFNGKKILSGKTGIWYHAKMEFQLGKGYTGKAKITIKPSGEKAKTVEMPFPGKVNAWNWLGLAAGANKEGIFYLDDLTVKRVVNGKTEWPIKEDFEQYTPMGRVAVDKAKGAEILISDKVAVSGKRALEVRDAAGIQHSWGPMVRFIINTTVSRNLYCPMFASDIPGDGRTYRTLNWGIVPQQKTLHRSPILYYVQTRDIGDGVIEITYVVHNFSARKDIVFDWLNAPWGGTRVTSLPHHYMSSPENKLMDREWVKKNCGAIDVRKTGGWNLSCATEKDDSPSLALVFGRDKNLEAELKKKEQGKPYCQFNGSIYRHMLPRLPKDWKTRPENSFRNYEVAVVIPRFNLAPGTTIWYRSYLVINSRDKTIKLAKSLVDKVDYGLLTFDPKTTKKVPVFIKDGKVVANGSKPAFELFSKPVPGAMPLFLIGNKKTGRELITTDLYSLVPQVKLDFVIPKDHPKYDYYSKAIGYSLNKNNTKWKRLLGYGYVKKPQKGSWKPLSKVVGKKLFAKPNTYNLDLWVNKTGL